MTIAEFFVELGVKGSEKSVNAFKSVKNGLGDIKSMSLQTKAALIGVMYGLERMMSGSAKMGTGLTNFEALTGLSAKSLQQWQYAARQAGVSSEEFTGNLKGVQQAMTNMLMGKGAPEGMGLLANQVGFDPARARDTFYVMEQLQKFAQSGVGEDLSNSVMKSFGLGEGTIAAMRRNMFTESTFKKAPTYSEGETKQLDKVNVAWSNLGQKIEMAFGRFTAKHGMQLVRDISKIVTEVTKLAEAFVVLAEKIKIFGVIGKVFEGWTGIFKGVTSVVDDLSEKEFGTFLKDAAVGTGEVIRGMGGGKDMAFEEMMAKQLKKPEQKSAGNTQNMVINQNLNFQHDGKDYDKTSSSVKEAVNKAYRQNSALKGGF